MSTEPECTDPARFARSVSRYCCSRDLIPDTGDVAVAFSGGPDSTALLHVLEVLVPGRVTAVHVDHGITERSDEMAAAAAALAGAVGVPVEVVAVAVPAEAVRAKGLEAAARDVRYAALAAAAQGIGAAVCAVGHTADDRAETLLMNLMRGSGLDGLATMRPRRGIFVRPLLGSRRAEAIGYCAAVGLEAVVDPSNSDTTLLRNRVRSDLVPVLERLRPGALGRIAQAAARLEADADLIAEIAAGAGDGCCLEGHDHVAFDPPALAAQPRPVAARIVRAALTPLLGGVAPPAAATAAVLDGRPGQLAGTPLTSRREGDEFVVMRPRSGTAPVALPSLGFAAVFGRRVVIRSCPEGVALAARPLADGDRITGRPRTLRDLLAREGVPRRLRDEALTILADGEVAGAAVDGHRWVGRDGIDVKMLG